MTGGRPERNGAARRPSITDVAVAAGVSRAAVSKVIRKAYGVSPTMRSRVEAAIDALGYRPRVGARALRGSGYTIGFEAPHTGNAFFTQVLSGAAPTLAESGYQLIIAPDLGYLATESVLESLVDRQVDGIIAIASRVDDSWLERLGAEIPLVVLGRHTISRAYDVLVGDDTAGTGLIMDHLFGLGHRRIAHVTFREPSARSSHTLRRAAYLRRMLEAGARPTVVEVDAEPDAYEATLELLAAADAPTAVFAGHDTMALEVQRAVADADRGPLSVVGYDGTELAAHPLVALTTVDQFGTTSGHRAVELLMSRINGRTAPEHVQLEPVLRVRGSTGPPA